MTNSDFAKEIQQGEQKRRKTDFPAAEQAIIDVLQYLTAAQLNKVAIYITELRRAAWGLTKDPEPPTIDEGPDVDTKGPCTSLSTDEPPGTFTEALERDNTNPLPLDGMEGGK